MASCTCPYREGCCRSARGCHILTPAGGPACVRREHDGPSRCAHVPLRITIYNSADEQEVEGRLVSDAGPRHRPTPASERDLRRDRDGMGQPLGGRGAATGPRSHDGGLVASRMGVDRRATSSAPCEACLWRSGPVRSSRDRRIAPSRLGTGRETFPKTAPGARPKPSRHSRASTSSGRRMSGRSARRSVEEPSVRVSPGSRDSEGGRTPLAGPEGPAGPRRRPARPDMSQGLPATESRGSLAKAASARRTPTQWPCCDLVRLAAHDHHVGLGASADKHEQSSCRNPAHGPELNREPKRRFRLDSP